MLALTQSLISMGLKGKKLQRQYRDYLSEFKDWKHLKQASNRLVYPENIGK